MTDLKTTLILSVNLFISPEVGLKAKIMIILMWFATLNSQITTTSDGFASARTHIVWYTEGYFPASSVTNEPGLSLTIMVSPQSRINTSIA